MNFKSQYVFTGEVKGIHHHSVLYGILSVIVVNEERKKFIYEESLSWKKIHSLKIFGFEIIEKFSIVEKSSVGIVSLHTH